MKPPKEMTLAEWQEAINACLAEMPWKEWLRVGPPLAMRIEDTMFSVARHTGGMTFRGHLYTYFEPPTGGRNADGSPEVAWLVVRDDLLRWVDEKRKGEARDAAKAKADAKERAEAAQGRLFG